MCFSYRLFKTCRWVRHFYRSCKSHITIVTLRSSLALKAPSDLALGKVPLLCSKQGSPSYHLPPCLLCNRWESPKRLLSQQHEKSSLLACGRTPADNPILCEYIRTLQALKLENLGDRPCAQFFRSAQKGGVARVERFQIPLDPTLLDHVVLTGHRDGSVQCTEHVCAPTVEDRVGPRGSPAHRFGRPSSLG